MFAHGNGFLRLTNFAHGGPTPSMGVLERITMTSVDIRV
jgi:hypothetical protein